jgi:hypothetical protein
MKLPSVLSAKQKKGIATFAIVLSTALALLVIDDEFNTIRDGMTAFDAFKEQVEDSRRLSLEQLGENGADPTPVTVFYNAYFPPKAATDDSVKDRIVGILNEQMKQVGVQSALAGRANVVVRTYTIGAQLDYKEIIADACAEINLVCTHERHDDQGFEMLTQQHLLEYCQLPENESHIVGYIHNKGSFHPSEGQNKNRRKQTADALSEQCINRLDTEHSCNVCGSSFISAWGPMMWGNFWCARCDYVKNLVKPSLLEEKNTPAFEQRPQEMTVDLFNDQAMDYALPTDSRFAAELFIGTHPRLIPCSITHDRTTWWSGNPPTRFRNSIIAHHVPLKDGETYEEHMDELESDGHALTDYYLLPGILWRYHVLYNEMPPADSWMWRHYPDGEKWHHAVEKLGYPEAFYHRYENELVKTGHSSLREVGNQTNIEMS